MRATKTLALLACLIYLQFVLGCSSSTTPSEPTHFAFSYAHRGTTPYPWKADGTSLMPLPALDSAVVGGWQNATGGNPSEQFTIFFHGVHAPGTYQIGTLNGATVSATYLNSLANYTMLPGGTVTVTTFNSASTVDVSEYQGTFSGTMVGQISTIHDTIVVTNGVFNVPN